MLSIRCTHSCGSNCKETVPIADSPIPVSLPVPLSADSCVVCHLKQADEGGTHPRESELKSLPRQSISLESALLPQGLKNFVLFGNSLSLMMYKCMTQFCGFQHLDAGNLLKAHFTYYRDGPRLLSKLPPGFPNRKFLIHRPLRRGAEMLLFHYYISVSSVFSFLFFFLSFDSSIKIEILIIS